MLSYSFVLIWVNTYKNNIFSPVVIINNVQQIKKINATDCIKIGCIVVVCQQVSA